MLLEFVCLYKGWVSKLRTSFNKQTGEKVKEVPLYHRGNTAVKQDQSRVDYDLQDLNSSFSGKKSVLDDPIVNEIIAETRNTGGAETYKRLYEAKQSLSSQSLTKGNGKRSSGKRQKVTNHKELPDNSEEKTKTSLDNKTEEKSDVRKKKSKAGLIVFIFVVLLLVGFVLIFGNKIYSTINGLQNSTGSVVEETEYDYNSAINALYTDEFKTDLVQTAKEDVQVIIDTLSGTKMETTEAERVKAELSTVLRFIKDREIIETLNNPILDVTSESVTSALSSVLANVNKYSVSGLAETMTSMANELLAEKTECLNIKGELEAVVDYESFEDGGYYSRIESIKHTVNHDELYALLGKVVAEKDVYFAEKNLSEQQALSEDDEGYSETGVTDAEKQLEMANEARNLAEEELERAVLAKQSAPIITVGGQPDVENEDTTSDLED